MISPPLLDAKSVPSLLRDAVVLDARAGPEAAADYAAGHVRGAIRVDLETELSAPGDPRGGGRHPLPSWNDWLARLGHWGIDGETPVIVYDASSGAMAAARAWWMVRAVGHTHVAVVDGGLAALRAADVPIVDDTTSVRSRPPYQTSRTQWPVVDAAFVERIRSDDRWRLVDARAPERYRGEAEPTDPVAGHIPGARNLYWKSLVEEDGLYTTVDVRREAYAHVRAGVDPDKVVCYCGSGVTACHLILGMEAAGVSGAQLYVGSWSEWCRIRPSQEMD